MPSDMPSSQALFATTLYRAMLDTRRNKMLEKTSLAIAAEDKAGRRWAKEHQYGGYTSYASLNDLIVRASIFAELERDIARHVSAFARQLQFDLTRNNKTRKLVLDSFWINVMDKGAIHAPHIHPHSVISGTYYVTAPEGAGALRFEDPRLGLMMAAPPKKKNARTENQNFVSMAAKPGLLLLWESWLRHGVEPNRARTRRISVSFNYRLD